MTKLAISLIVHGESNYIIPCLESIHAASQLPTCTVVVANTGENAAIRQVRKQFPKVDVLVNTEPRGFAANHNRVMALASAPYIALLNDDLIVLDEALDRLVEFLDTHPEAGVVGPRLLNPDGSLQPSTYGDPTLFKMLWRLLDLQTFTQNPVVRRLVHKVLRPLFPRTLARYWEHDQVADVEVLTGAAMVVRRAALDAVGPMAEIARVYGEEIEWHLRFRKAGWKLYLVPQAAMIHYGEKSTGGARNYRLFLDMRKSLLYYFYTHRLHWEYQTFRSMVVITHLMRWVICVLPAIFSPVWREQRNINLQVIRLALHWSDRMSTQGPKVN